MTHPRTVIRAYARDMLKAGVDVGNRVYLNRPLPFLIDSLPAISIMFATETNDVVEGDNYIPQMYNRNLTLQIDIVAEQQNSPDGGEIVEELLDKLAWQVERLFKIDNFFQERLSGYADHNSPGLLAGSRILSSTPDSLVTDNDRVLACQTIMVLLIWQDEAFEEEKGSLLDSYTAKINRYDYDDDTVDPTLIECFGEDIHE